MEPSYSIPCPTLPSPRIAYFTIDTNLRNETLYWEHRGSKEIPSREHQKTILTLPSLLYNPKYKEKQGITEAPPEAAKGKKGKKGNRDLFR